MLYVFPENFCFVCKTETPELNKKLITLSHIKVDWVVISDSQARAILSF